MKNSLIYGRNSVMEALRGGRSIEKIIVQKGAGGSLGRIISLAKDMRVPMETLTKDAMDRIAGTTSHQGVILKASAFDYTDWDELLRKAKKKEGPALIIVLDEIEDPHNLGAIMRTAECAGADGMVIPKNRSCGLTETVAKVSAGAIEYMPCAKVTNLVRTLEELKESGFWIYGADMDGEGLWEADMKGKVAIVIGNEGKGLSKLVKEKCDFIVSIPMVGHIDSLNASNAAALLMYEVIRQRKS